MKNVFIIHDTAEKSDRLNDGYSNAKQKGVEVEISGKKYKLTHESLSLFLDYSINTVRAWFCRTNKLLPSIDVYIRLANIFGCDVDYLLCLQDEPNKEFAHIAEITGLSYNAAAYLESMANDKSYNYVAETLSALLEQMQEAETLQKDGLLLSLANCIYTEYFPDDEAEIGKFKAYRQSDIMDLYGKLQTFINERRKTLEYKNP